MTLGQLLALICIIIGFLVGGGAVVWLFGATTWFIAAIAIMLTIGGFYPIPVGRRRE